MKSENNQKSKHKSYFKSVELIEIEGLIEIACIFEIKNA